MSTPKRTTVKVFKVHEVDDEGTTTNKFDVVVRIREHVCPKCSWCDSNAEVLSFGIQSDYDAEDASAVFYWCGCGHKWIEEPKAFPKGPGAKGTKEDQVI